MRSPAGIGPGETDGVGAWLRVRDRSPSPKRGHGAGCCGRPPVLRPGGELWVVGNRHLEYNDKLNRAFGNSEVMANNPKFQVIRAIG